MAMKLSRRWERASNLVMGMGWDENGDKVVGTGGNWNYNIIPTQL